MDKSPTYLLTSALTGLLFGTLLGLAGRFALGFVENFSLLYLAVPFFFLHTMLKRNRWRNGREWYTLFSSAAGLGVTLAQAIALIGSDFTEYGWFLIFIVFYHFGEYSITAYFHAPDCSVSSFLIDHSSAYSMAFVAGQCEYFSEKLSLQPFWKGDPTVTTISVVILVICEFFRKGSMINAGVSFTHMVAYEKREEHRLVTSGLYRFVRHPGYFGWFWWSIFTQVLLANPFCIVAYAVASWHFFADRIPDEEKQLIEFFPGEYEEYRARTPTLIPFIP